MAMAKPFFTKKQKAKMRERRKKIKQLEASKKQEGDSSSVRNNDVDINNDDPTLSVVTNDESKPSKKRSREEALSHEKSTNLSSSSDLLELSSSLGFAAMIMNGKLVVTVPSSVSGKDAKKFRKDARRKLRTEGVIDDAATREIEFISQDQTKQQQGQDADSNNTSNKKRKKNFPSIQELLQQKKHEKEVQKENDRKEKKLQQIPDEYKNRYVAMDCEMVGIGTDGKKSALARVSLVDWNMNVVLDTFVQVPTRVTDFRTHVSGVSPKHINPTSSNAMDVKKCRDQVAKILQDKILVGHALSNDLKALLLQHPKHMIRDTAKYRPFQRYGNNKWRPRKLRDLVKEHLLNSNSKNNNGSNIDFDGFQESSHDSVQDAKATMELFQLVHTQWEKEITSKQK